MESEINGEPGGGLTEMLACRLGGHIMVTTSHCGLMESFRLCVHRGECGVNKDGRSVLVDRWFDEEEQGEQERHLPQFDVAGKREIVLLALEEAGSPPRAARLLKLEEKIFRRWMKEVDVQLGAIPPSVRTILKEKRARLQEALDQACGEKTQAAAILGVSRTTLYKWLEESDLRKETK